MSKVYKLALEGLLIMIAFQVRSILTNLILIAGQKSRIVMSVVTTSTEKPTRFPTKMTSKRATWFLAEHLNR